MTRLELARSRAEHRRGQAGAAMFVVAMTIAVLASVGVYALTSAATEIKTSGNERQNTQTHFMASYGIIGAAHELTATKAQWYLGVMLTPSTTDTQCIALPNMPTNADAMVRACRRVGSAELSGQWAGAVTVPYSASTPFGAGVDPGSFGPTPMGGDFFVELTDPEQANAPARYALDLHFCFIRLTASAGGITRPLFPGVTDQTGVYGSEGVEMQRARFVAGPVQCPK
ncbi:MAG: hypothetical protein M3O50_00920 [Myxococcota bacterium]|nr:hypothetical protein [Myxococcota bacterium]